MPFDHALVLRVPRGPAASALAALEHYGHGTLSDPTLLDRLTTAAPPALIIWGEDDPIAPLGYGRALAESLPDAEFVPIPGAGHVPYRGAPSAVWAALDAYQP